MSVSRWCEVVCSDLCIQLPHFSQLRHPPGCVCQCFFISSLWTIDASSPCSMTVGRLRCFVLMKQKTKRRFIQQHISKRRENIIFFFLCLSPKMLHMLKLFSCTAVRCCYWSTAPTRPVDSISGWAIRGAGEEKMWRIYGRWTWKASSLLQAVLRGYSVWVFSFGSIFGHS